MTERWMPESPEERAATAGGRDLLAEAARLARAAAYPPVPRMLGQGRDAAGTWIITSTTWNYGPGWEPPLLEAYGVAPDPERTRYYRLLRELGP